MSARRREEFEDDGRTIADMSGVTRRSLFGGSLSDLHAAPQDPPKTEESTGGQDELTREERFWAFLGMLKAILLIGLCFAAGMALVILAFQYL